MRRLLSMLALALAVIVAGAQDRRVTPVVPVTSRPVAPVKVKTEKEKKQKGGRPGSVTEITDDLGNTILIDTISGNEWVDSVAMAQTKVIGNIYPLWDAVSVGIDAWPAVSRAFGGKQGLTAVWGQLSLHNRYFPTFELGVSSAGITPDGMNFTYRQPVAPYFKIGIDYNFFYNSNPDYKIFGQFRYGFSYFRYYVDDVTLGNGYWQHPEHLDLPGQTTATGYLEFGIGIAVKLFGPFSAGWSVKYHKILHHSVETYGAPWSVPGYGSRKSDLGIQFSIIYTLPLHAPIPINEEEEETTTKKK